MTQYIIKILLLMLFLAIVASSCGKKSTLSGIFNKTTPHEAYQHSLEKAQLDETALGAKWIRKGEAVFEDSLYVTLPFSEEAYFDASAVMANGYRFAAERGQRLIISLKLLSKEELKIFMDLFLIEDEPKHLISADTAVGIMEHEIKKDGEYFLRLQPELLRSGRFILSITSKAALSFPILDKDYKSIASFFGASRDAGVRKHEGVDIFAPRSTPVLAVANGSVTRVNTNRLGGKVVWQRDPERNLSYYYAHLDSQLVSPGQRVDIGDTVGLVGNTGNAITTPPHLHFGIYASGYGAIDPYSFFHTKNSVVSSNHDGNTLIGKTVRISAPAVNFRMSPDLKSSLVSRLPKNTMLRVQSATGNWLRVETGDLKKGYIHHDLVEAIESPIKSTQLANEGLLYDYPGSEGIMIQRIPTGDTISIMAEHGNYYYVSFSDRLGWLEKPQ